MCMNLLDRKRPKHHLSEFCAQSSVPNSRGTYSFTNRVRDVYGILSQHCRIFSLHWWKLIISTSALSCLSDIALLSVLERFARGGFSHVKLLVRLGLYTLSNGEKYKLLYIHSTGNVFGWNVIK